MLENGQIVGMKGASGKAQDQWTHRMVRATWTEAFVCKAPSRQSTPANRSASECILIDPATSDPLLSWSASNHCCLLPRQHLRSRCWKEQWRHKKNTSFQGNLLQWEFCSPVCFLQHYRMFFVVLFCFFCFDVLSLLLLCFRPCKQSYENGEEA